MNFLERLRLMVQIARWRVLWIAPLWMVQRRFLVFERDLDASVAPADPSIVAEHADEAAFAELPQVNPLLTPAMVAQRRAAGLSCWIAREGDRIVHYRWYADAPAHLHFIDLPWEPLPEKEYMGLDTFTVADARGRGIHSAMSAQHVAFARAHGYTRVLGLIAWWHTPSIRAVKRLGMRATGSVTLWPWLGMHTARGSAVVADGRLRIQR